VRCGGELVRVADDNPRMRSVAEVEGSERFHGHAEPDRLPGHGDHRIAHETVEADAGDVQYFIPGEILVFFTDLHTV